METRNIRIALRAIYYASLTIGGASLIYVLFIFGHSETAPLSRVLFFTVLACVSAVVGGVLQWVGLPAPEEDTSSKKGRKGPRGGRRAA